MADSACAEAVDTDITTEGRDIEDEARAGSVDNVAASDGSVFRDLTTNSSPMRSMALEWGRVNCSGMVVVAGGSGAVVAGGILGSWWWLAGPVVSKHCCSPPSIPAQRATRHPAELHQSELQTAASCYDFTTFLSCKRGNSFPREYPLQLSCFPALTHVRSGGL